jgi:hypothetical protein
MFILRASQPHATIATGGGLPRSVRKLLHPDQNPRISLQQSIFHRNGVGEHYPRPVSL